MNRTISSNKLKGVSECLAQQFPHIDYLLMNRVLRKTERVQMGMEIYLSGQRYYITAERQQILDQLISIYEEAVQMNAELHTRQRQLAHSNQILAGLYRIAEGLNHAATEQEVVEKAVQRALDLPDIRSSWIMLCEGDSSLRLAADCNLPPVLAAPEAMQGDCLCRRQLIVR